MRRDLFGCLLERGGLLDRRSALKTMGWVAGVVGLGRLRADACSGLNAFAAVDGPREEEQQRSGRQTDDGALARILPDFSAESRRRVGQVVRSADFSGQIPASVVRELAAAEGKPADAVMLGLLPLAKSYSHAPISEFHVGAIARGASGNLYLGFNVEIPGQMLGFAVHGEQAALSSAYMHGEDGVEAIGIAGGAPCGHCRQFMNEFSPDGELEVVIQGATSPAQTKAGLAMGTPVKLAELLPRPFGPKALGRTQGALPVRETGLVVAADADSRYDDRSARTGVPAPREQDGREARRSTSDALVQAAVEAARGSYAPYSGANAGVAIAARSGRVYKGSYIENVAFNPSLSPLQTALVQMIVAGEEYEAIARVVLAEISPHHAKTARDGDPGAGGAKVSQWPVTEAVLGAVAKGVKVEVVGIKEA